MDLAVMCHAPASPGRSGRAPALVSVLAALLWVFPLQGEEPSAARSAAPDAELALAQIDRLEELLLALTPKMKTLATSVENLELPDFDSSALFDGTVEVVDLGSEPGAPAETTSFGLESMPWPTAPGARSLPRRSVRLWRPFLDAVEFFTHQKFKITRGRFLDPSESRYLAEVSFSSVARMASGHYASGEAKLELTWKQESAAGQETMWRITTWRTKSFLLTRVPHPLFVEVLDRALPDPAQLEQARTSIHEELVRAQLLDPEAPPPHKYFKFQSLDRHPGIAVADIDRDGLDDLYVMERWGPNMLLRNRGDGTFEDIAAQVGLDVRDHCSSALFADFDNDGDLDLFLGRTLVPSLYFVNQDGTFIERSAELVETPLPTLVSSISAADVDGDGLLDVYFSTYATDGDLQKDLLPAESVAGIAREWRAGGHVFRNRPGPPNLLLRNLGSGRFGASPHSETAAVWRSTYQSTWSDFDADGDLDVYVANDFSPNNMLRNDGQGRFTDVTAETGTADIGFGMGASWADYDDDGAQDLYVTNMYSTAGRRITELLGPQSGDLSAMARGNSLYRNAGGQFTKVSGLEPPALLVEKAGWAWGGQFLDVDNDTYLDIYSPSGYYTAPELIGDKPDL